MRHSSRVAAVSVMVAAAFVLLVHALGAPARLPSAALASLPEDREAACAGDNPYLVTVCYRLGASSAVMAREPAVVAFRDTPANGPHHQLATQAQVGSVYGLAYSAREVAVYAAAFHKRQIPFGPGGPGAVYRIDLVTGAVVHAFTVPNAGDDRHSTGLDRLAEPWAGKASLGDIDLGADGTELFVANLHDRRIYRYALPEGRLLGSFAHGAGTEPWAAEARPFGLAVRDGLVYHAVVRTAEDSGRRADLALYVYESAPDGTGMRRVAESPLDYRRGMLTAMSAYGTAAVSVEWLPWADRPSNLVSEPQSDYAFVHPMPAASDVIFGPAGEIVVGLRDRVVDMMSVPGSASVPAPPRADPYGQGAGDMVRGLPLGAGWQLEPVPEHFDDDFAFNDETTLGGLVALGATGTVVSNGWGNDTAEPTVWGESPGVIWFDAAGGGKVRFEGVCRTYGLQPRLALTGIERAWADNEGPVFAGSTGDVELLCGDAAAPTATESLPPPHTSTATRQPTATASPTPTTASSASATRTARPTSTPGATPLSAPLYLPLLLGEHCAPEHKRADVALVIDTSSSMTGRKLEDAKSAAAAFVRQMDLAPGRDQVAVVRYDTEAEVVCRLTAAGAVIEAAIRNLTSRSGTHIDKGVRAALAELQGPRHLERNLPVIVLLTDGVQTGTPGEELRAADEVRSAGVRLYAVGLGADVDAATLLQMVGDVSRYRFAPDSADLARIYAEIAGDILCPAPPGGFWPWR